MVTNREKNAGILIPVSLNFVTHSVTFGYKRLQNGKTLYSIYVTARYKPNRKKPAKMPAARKNPCRIKPTEQNENK